jgi:predicted amidohydrolase
MALLRYKYTSREDVEPWSEVVPQSVDMIETITDSTNTFKWVHRVSKKYKAWVQCGFVERHTDGRFYNSLVLMHAEWKQMHIVRKVYLYEADKKWS